MKTSKLTGAALDWAVAKADGRDHVVRAPNKYVYEPSTNWAQGGPIIERECIDLYQSGIWSAEIVKGEGVIHAEGPTPLVAAMRCFVASRLGEEVDVTSELLEV